MTVNRLTVDVLHIIGKEGGDVLIGAPVQWHTQVIAILGFKLFFQVFTVKQISAEPVQIGKLLRRQLVELAVWRGSEAGADEVFDIQARIGVFLACAGHVVRQIQDLAVAVVGADQVGVANPAVINRLARLHRGLQLFDHVALLNQVVLDLDAGDFLKGFSQCLGLILVCGDGL